MKRYSLFLLLIPFLLVACGSDATVNKMVLSPGLNEKGEPQEESTRFNRGDTVYACIEFSGGYDGLESDAQWKHAEDVLKEEPLILEKAPDPLDALWLCSCLETESDWASGTYQFEVLIPDQGKTTLEFSLQ